MNSQIAITLLKDLEQSLDDYCELNDEGKEAFHMAITALELFGNSEQLPSTHSKLEKNSPKLDKEIGECNDCIKHGGDWECDRVHCHKGDTISRQDAIDALSDIEVSKMEHCVGFDRKKIYRRGGMAYFKPYRNYYDAGGTDVKVWERLVERGFADCAEPKKDGGKYYWLNRSGLNILSAYEECYIYSENARGNEIDASEDVIDILLDDDVYCGYGCWIPSGARSIAIRARLPYKLTLSTLKYLRDKCGYVAHSYEGGCNDDGEVHCTHGWTLTKKWIDEHQERYKAAQKEEYERIDRIVRGEAV